MALRAERSGPRSRSRAWARRGPRGDCCAGRACKNLALILKKPSAHSSLEGSPESSTGWHYHVAAIGKLEEPAPHSLEVVPVVPPVNMSPGPSREELTWRTMQSTEQMQGVQIGGPWTVPRFRPAFCPWRSPWSSPWHSWLQASRIPDPLPEGATEIPVSGLDYRRFKLFHLSIAWRTGVAAGDDYAPIDLGDHQEPLRQMLLAGDPGRPTDYPVFACVLRMRLESRPATGTSALAPPERRGDVEFTSTAYAGCGWYCA